MVENSIEKRKLSNIGIKKIDLKIDHFDVFFRPDFEFLKKVKWSKILCHEVRIFEK